MSFEEREAFKDYLNLVQKCMNPDVDPRDDFFEYASGRSRSADFNEKNGEYPPTMFACDNAIKSVIENEQISNATLEKARNFYRSRQACLEGGLNGFLRSDQFNEFCGGFPAFNDNWNEENFDWVKAAAILQALEFNSIFILFMQHIDDKKIIIIHINFRTDIQDECFEKLDLEDIKLAEIISDMNMFKGMCPRRFLENTFEYPKEDRELLNNIDIFDFKVFLGTAHSVTIEDKDIIKFDYELKDYLSFLNSLNRRMLANFLTAMATYERADDDRNIGFGLYPGRIFQPILISACFEKFYSEEQDENYRRTAKMFLRALYAIEENFPNCVLGPQPYRFSSHDNLVEYMEKNFNPSKIRKEYENLQISPDNFYQNLISIKNHGIPKSVQKYDRDESVDFDNVNAIVPTFLCDIIPHWNKPMAFYFSGKHVSYWKHVLYDWNGSCELNNIKKDYLYETLKSQAKEFCDDDDGDNSDDDDGDNSDDDDGDNYDDDDGDNYDDDYLDLAGFTAVIEGIKYAYRDYKKWMKLNAPTVKWQNEMLSKINLDCEKLFFIAFAQHNNNYTTTTLTLMNCEDFSKCFKCCTESRMNPRKFLL